MAQAIGRARIAVPVELEFGPVQQVVEYLLVFAREHVIGRLGQAIHD